MHQRNRAPARKAPPCDPKPPARGFPPGVRNRRASPKPLRKQMRESRFLEEVMEEGRMEGALKTKRADILQVLEIRSGAEAAAGVREPPGRITELDRLSELHAVAIGSRRIADFRRALEAVSSAR